MELFEQPSSFELGKVPSEEPIGIVISRGADVEPRPRLFAYVWGEAPALEGAPLGEKAT
jgi:hypothetical protein